MERLHAAGKVKVERKLFIEIVGIVLEAWRQISKSRTGSEGVCSSETGKRREGDEERIYRMTGKISSGDYETVMKAAWRPPNNSIRELHSVLSL